MFGLAVSLGIYSYLIFLLGILGLLYKPVVAGVTIASLVAFLFLRRRETGRIWGIRGIRGIWLGRDKIFVLFALVVALQAGINLIGALGPELAFDALWYHLTLPKLYLAQHSISYIPGGLLYYSAMPKLGEMLYTGALSMGTETIAKVLHFTFGIFCLISIYKLTRKFYSPTISMIACAIFYGNLVVGFESITAYIDLTRTFFEILALWAFLNWHETREDEAPRPFGSHPRSEKRFNALAYAKGFRERDKWLMMVGLMVGLAVTTKLLALGSLGIFVLLLAFGMSGKFGKQWKFGLLSRIGVALIIPLPWFLFAFFYTGNPVYPFLTALYPTSISPGLLSPVNFITEIWNILMRSPDPLSPVYLFFLPLIIFYYKRQKKEIKIIALYSLLALLFWYVTPRTGGGRFILPYLPAFSILCAAVLAGLERNKFIFRVSILFIFLVSLISIGYRGAANAKYVPVLLGSESKNEFLSKRLNFSYGDFYDTDGHFKSKIKNGDRVLLYGLHNLYYADFPFVDSSWAEKGDKFNYVALQHVKLPDRFKNWKLIYINGKTGVELYNKDNKVWEY